MRAMCLCVSLCAVFLFPVNVWGDMYTWASVNGADDGGLKPYSHAENTVEGVYMEATCQIEENTLSALSRLTWYENSYGFPYATTLTSVEWDLEVIANGPASLTWALSGVVEVNVAAFEEYPEPFIADYSMIIDSTWGDMGGSDGYFEADGFSSDQTGYYYLPVSSGGVHDFAETYFTAGDRIHVIIDLTATAQGGAGWAAGSTMRSDFLNSLDITGMNNVFIIPEPGSVALIGLGFVLMIARRRKS